MKKQKLFVILLACALMLSVSAMAGASVSGTLNGNGIDVQWSASGTLTLYQDNWPVCVRGVRGPGSARFAIDDPRAHYSLRLTSDCGNAWAEVVGQPQQEPTPQITEAPTAIPTEALTPVPTEVPTKAPMPKPTEAPTAKPTAMPTAKPTATPTAKPAANRDGLARQVVDLVNAERAKQGLGSLRIDAELTRAACVRAGEITRTFSHTRPDGTGWATVSASAYGENIARGQNTAEKVMAAWMSSTTGHRENILRATYGSIGVCVTSYNGALYWVQLFGK